MLDVVERLGGNLKIALFEREFSGRDRGFQMLRFSSADAIVKKLQDLPGVFAVQREVLAGGDEVVGGGESAGRPLQDRKDFIGFTLRSSALAAAQ